jgi:hypothetical protein
MLARGTKDKEHAMAEALNRSIAFAGIDIGKNSFHVVGLNERGASRQAYMNQLRQPYAWAAPDHDKKDDAGRPVLAIPGNHDWYDGLVLFLTFFCKEKPWHLGEWRSYQRRSYFAVRIMEGWWLWATDIQLADDMDQPQADYFKHIAAIAIWFSTSIRTRRCVGVRRWSTSGIGVN